LSLSTFRPILRVEFDKVMVVKCEGKGKGNEEVFFGFIVAKSCNNTHFTRKVCTNNRRAVACWSQQGCASLSSGLPLSNKVSLFSNGFYHCNHRRQKIGCGCLFQHSGLFCASNSIRFWSLNVKGRIKGNGEVFFGFFVAKSC